MCLLLISIWLPSYYIIITLDNESDGKNGIDDNCESDKDKNNKSSDSEVMRTNKKTNIRLPKGSPENVGADPDFQKEDSGQWRRHIEHILQRDNPEQINSSFILQRNLNVRLDMDPNKLKTERRYIEKQQKITEEDPCKIKNDVKAFRLIESSEAPIQDIVTTVETSTPNITDNSRRSDTYKFLMRRGSKTDHSLK
ncbi:hypothetical protein FQA39_LY05360 [Lamprigera yunnana]|nr:hypothetical protein FQA39_LY05360 [Lamprigera yunnana]